MFDYSFEWSRKKELGNIRKHGISFQEAKSVFFDPDYLEEFDREINGEERFWAIGFSNNGRILVVVHSFRGVGGRSIRIISARNASKNEADAYVQFRR